MLQTESEQSRLLLEDPEIVAEEIVVETEPEKIPDNAEVGNDLLVRPIPENILDSPTYDLAASEPLVIPVPVNILDGPTYGLAASEHVSTQISGGVDAAGSLTNFFFFYRISSRTGFSHSFLHG